MPLTLCYALLAKPQDGNVSMSEASAMAKEYVKGLKEEQKRKKKLETGEFWHG